jgi:outer membrane usher protein FimD/PapC
VRYCSVAPIVAAALLVAVPAVAQERSIWALVLNDEPKGDVEIVLTADGPWVDPAALLGAGVQKVPDGRRQAFAPDTISRVSLASLAPQITFTLDEAEIRLIISAEPALLSTTELAISNPRPPGWKVSSNKAIFLNYSSNWSTDDKTSGYGELGVHVFGALFESAASVDETGAITPGLTSLTFDQVRGRRRWVLGDTIGRSTTLGSSPVSAASVSRRTRISIRITPSTLSRRSGAPCARRRRRTSTSTVASSRRCGCRPDDSR